MELWKFFDESPAMSITREPRTDQHDAVSPSASTSADDAWQHVITFMASAESYTAQLRAQLGLSANEMNALMSLHVQGSCAVSELARRVQLSRPAMTTLIDRLLARGWVERTAHPGDRRKVIIDLADRFEQELHAASRTWRQRLTNFASSRDDWADIVELIGELSLVGRRSADELAAQSRASITRPGR
jgi:DNA-binding MarR family transcriptional regulator